MSVRLTVSQLIEAFGVSYQTIDIRLGAIHKNGTWINALTTLRLSRRSVEDVKGRYKYLLDQYGQVATEHFRIELMAMPFRDWPKFLSACSEGVLHLGELSVKWAEPPRIDEEIGLLQRQHSDLRDQDRWTWPSLSNWCGGKPPRELQNDDLIRGVAAKGWSNPHQAINAICEMNITQGSPYAQEIYFSIPVYVSANTVAVSTVDSSVHFTYLRHSAIKGLSVTAFLKDRNPAMGHMRLPKAAVRIQSERLLASQKRHRRAVDLVRLACRRSEL